MPRTTRFLEAVLAGLCFLTATEAVTTTILEPIRSTGDEVGLIFIPEIFYDGQMYNKTAQAIQESSDLRVWVALTGDYLFDLTNAAGIQMVIQQAIAEFQQAGMTSGHYVGVGHGVGGNLLEGFATGSNLTALVLMGSTLSRKTQLSRFPIPVLTLAAELDGVTRITRVVKEFEKLSTETTSFFQGLYRNPVLLVEGANHAQFSSGKIKTKTHTPNDLAADISEQQAHSLIGKYVNDFLTVTFSSVDSQVGNSLTQLMEAFLKSARIFQPFLDTERLDTDGKESMWTVLAQKSFASEYSSRVAISNEVQVNPWFFSKQPSITSNNDSLIVGTTSLVHGAAKSDALQYRSAIESPLEIDMKLVSKDAIWKAFAGKHNVALRSEPNTCKSLNRFALYLALAVSTDAARKRYYARGRQIIFEEDAMRGYYILWAPSPLQMWEDKDGLHVRSVALVTDTEHYCKVMSPYRAMEWVNIDSLRADPK